MNFQLLALSGAHIAIIAVLAVIIAIQLGGVVYLTWLHIQHKRARNAKQNKQTETPSADEAPTVAEAPAAQAEPVSEEPQPAEEPVSEEAQPAEEPVTEETQPAEEPAEQQGEFTPEQIEAMLDEFDDAAPKQSSKQEDDLDELPEEPTNEQADDDEAAAFAEQIEQFAAAIALAADDDATAEDVAAEEQASSEPADQPAEQTEENAPEFVESTAETVEEILEEHGLTTEDEITEEIAEEIMAVHTARDEDAVQVVAVDGLYKKYSKKADWAVANVNFHCYEGEIVGLLGHNGAGKSTTLKCLEGMLPFDQGTISIYGHDIVKEPIAAKEQMGFVTDNHATFVKMTGMQYLSFMADVYQVPSDVRKERYARLEEVFQLGSAVNNLISSYSHGMRQKICMMGSLIHQPKLWVLDEPMTGLDPRTMHAVQQFMREYADAGNCIIFSSHALITVAKMCDRVVLLRTGNQLDELNIKRIMTVDPTFDFEEYFLKHEGQD